MQPPESFHKCPVISQRAATNAAQRAGGTHQKSRECACCGSLPLTTGNVPPEYQVVTTHSSWVNGSVNTLSVSIYVQGLFRAYR